MSQLIIYNKFKSDNFDQRKFDISLVIIHFTETKTFSDAYFSTHNKPSYREEKPYQRFGY